MPAGASADRHDGDQLSYRRAVVHLAVGGAFRVEERPASPEHVAGQGVRAGHIEEVRGTVLGRPPPPLLAGHQPLVSNRGRGDIAKGSSFVAPEPPV
ncbi:hypothetical protein AB0F59_16725 [Micromonospora lupini]|uniref:hypothetical protein n=1 Tax=Micromonospora lupini TaxID=285679 RepID=UPI0033F75246